VIVAPFLDTADAALAKQTLAEFYALEPVLDMTSVQPYTEVNKVMDPMMPFGPRTYMTALAYKTLSIPLLQLMADTYSTYISTLGADYIPGAILCEAYPYDKIIQVPSDATAYGNRGKHYSCVITLRWTGEDHDLWVRQFIKEFVKKAREVDTLEMESRGGEKTEATGYANFHLPGDDPAVSAFRGNFLKAREVKRKWDPEGKFNKWFSIPT
jgi:hypothetical protein